ncbi:MAG TPA: carbon-nitrogen hydrolase family protein [Fimbriimonadaceae bacterium]|nr:carbon-nitrogen hydrolase family protein [Fimbriimonadaceae bacterium]
MRLACVQCDVVFGDPLANARHAANELRRLAGEGVQLAVFPEAFLTGYCVDCLEDARSIAIPLDHEAIFHLIEVCNETGLHAIFGFAEETEGRIYNSAALIMPGYHPRVYRKTHLPEMGLDKHVSPGSNLPVFDTRLGKIAILICFDLRPPEAARVLTLRGAQLIVLVTNWPVGAETSADHIAIARAAENRVFLAACNRVGEEQGFRFIGRSKIIDPTGKVIEAAQDEARTIVADIDLDEALVKRSVMIPGKYEIAVLGCRRPELYDSLLQ